MNLNSTKANYFHSQAILITIYVMKLGLLSNWTTELEMIEF